MYKWKPSKSQRTAFAIKMQNPKEKAAYELRKMDREKKKRTKSKYNYKTAGGYYIPTKEQYNFAMSKPDHLTIKELHACDVIIYGYSCQEKIEHDYIHLINELIKK